MHYKYLHPKEVLISDGLLNRTVLEAVGKAAGRLDYDDMDGVATGKGGRESGRFDGTGLDFVYPYGATLSVQPPAVPILSSGKIAYPMHRPLGASALPLRRSPCATCGLLWPGKCSHLGASSLLE